MNKNSNFASGRIISSLSPSFLKFHFEIIIGSQEVAKKWEDACTLPQACPNVRLLPNYNTMSKPWSWHWYNPQSLSGSMCMFFMHSYVCVCTCMCVYFVALWHFITLVFCNCICVIFWNFVTHIFMWSLPQTWNTTVPSHGLPHAIPQAFFSVSVFSVFVLNRLQVKYYVTFSSL